MAKRGRKSESSSNSTKGRPRTRSRQTKAFVAEKSNQAAKLLETVQNTTKKSNIKSKTKTKTKTTEPKPKKSKTDEKPTKNKTINNKKAVTNNNKSQQKVQRVSKPPAAKRGRKPKIKNSVLEIKEIAKKRQVDEDDDETEEENIDENDIHLERKDEVVSNVNLDQNLVKEFPLHNASDVSYGFEDDSGFNKIQQPQQQENPIVKSFDHHFDADQQSYLSSLYNNNLISSSSTSAFSSVPTQPKFNTTNHITSLLHPPHSMITHNDIGGPMSTNMAHLATPSTPSMTIPPSQHPVSINPTHQSLLSPPQSQNSATTANDSVHDLPSELLQQGWRKFWSKREGRFYYYNKLTNESVWEMPKLSNIYDPLTDPLGIQAPNPAATQFQPPTPTDPGTPPIYPVFNPSFVSFMQNKNSDIINNDKKTFIGPFDFEIESNCYIWEGLFFYYFHPHPDIELARFNFVHKLRQQYWELCRTRQTIDPPKDSFTKWILERKVIDKGCDPFLPSECITELSNSLYTEIMNDIPIKLVKPKFSGEARKQLSKYAEAAKKIIDSPHVSAMSRKIVKWNVEDAFEWIRKTLNATYEDYIERLEHLKKQCQPHIVEAAKSSVESICLKIFYVAADYARRIREMNLELFKKEDLRERGPFRFQNQKKVICYPAYLINPFPKLPPVHMFNEKDTTLLRYKNGEILRLNTSYLQKLELLYYFNCRDDRKYALFLTRVWCLLKRYQSFYDKTEGLSSQNSLPLSVFAALNKHFGVTFECFSSPLNCYYRQYCSFFPDTDGYFGSRGSILNFYPMSGSFEANPPDSEDLIDASITHFEKLLKNSMEPLSFIIFIQDKPEISKKVISRLESNKFKRMHLTIQSLEHEYRHGFQHICNKNEVLTKSPYNTLIYFLQNDAGFLKWGPTPERVEELVESFKIGRDKELIILSPSSTPANNQQKSETEIRPNGNEN